MSESFDELVNVMARLRAPGGCPWDREQTYASLGQYLIEECYETYDAIREAEETGKTANLKEELGDVLLQVVFHSTIAAERGDFSIDEVVNGVTKKLVLRHPHVFEDRKLETADDVLQNWDELKKAERAASGTEKAATESILDEVPIHFPALLEAQKLTKKASKVGFDWENAAQVFEKIDEELSEVRAAVERNEKDQISEEIGDLLFSVINLARKLEVDAESSLRNTNRKFRKRFKFVEAELSAKAKSPESASLEEMDELWNSAKSH